MTMLKLIKISYIAHGWSLALTGKPLVREGIEAWKYGPVIPSLYHEFKRFKGSPIDCFSTELDLDTFDSTAKTVPESDEMAQRILDKVWGIYKTVDGGSLIDRTHAEGTPWKAHYEPDARGKAIPDDCIRLHYLDLLSAI